MDSDFLCVLKLSAYNFCSADFRGAAAFFTSSAALLSHRVSGVNGLSAASVRFQLHIKKTFCNAIFPFSLLLRAASAVLSAKGIPELRGYFATNNLHWRTFRFSMAASSDGW